MGKYEYGFKLKVVLEYLNGPLGTKLLAKKYQIPSKNTIQTWVEIYKRFGKEALKEQRKSTEYSGQFKLDVLQFKERTGSSYQETADHFDIRYASFIRRWNAIVEKNGIEGLMKKKKGPSPMSKQKKDEALKHPKSKAEAMDSTRATVREKELEQENERLRLEVAYLKKLESFWVQKASPEKSKRKWHSNSTKKDSN